MAESNPNTADDAAALVQEHRPSKRRWLRISLRSLMLLVTAACLVLGLVIVPAERQRRAVEEVDAAAGFCDYERMEKRWFADDAEREPFKTIRARLGRDYVDRIEGVVLAGPTAESCLQKHVGSLSHLKRLTLADTHFSEAAGGSLVRLRELTWLAMNDPEVRAAQLAWLPDDSKLTYLELNGTSVGNASLAYIARCSQLKTLRLYDVGLIGNGLDLARCPNLEFLELGKNFLRDEAWAGLAKLSKLRVLLLGHTRITDAGLPSLAQLASLERVDLSFTEVKNPGSALWTQPQLQLVLDGAAVDDESLIALARLPNLLLLSLNDTMVGDVGAEHLVNFDSAVEVLRFARAKLTDEGLVRLAGLRKLDRLTVSAPGVTNSGAAKFRKLRPDVQFDYER